jgi:hypothetical protein
MEKQAPHSASGISPPGAQARRDDRRGVEDHQVVRTQVVDDIGETTVLAQTRI